MWIPRFEKDWQDIEKRQNDALNLWDAMIRVYKSKANELLEKSKKQVNDITPGGSA